MREGILPGAVGFSGCIARRTRQNRNEAMSGIIGTRDSRAVEFFFGAAMRIFISWSGDRSKRIATALRGWIKKLIQAVEPWMSDKDIESGARWGTEISARLREAKVGIVCLTPENKEKPWINFEAGAISKTVEDVNLCPYLFEFEPKELAGPLSQFQTRKANREDTYRLVQTINRHPELATKLDEASLEQSFGLWWPEMEKELKQVPASPAKIVQRPSSDIAAETLQIVRELLRNQSRPPSVIPALVSQTNAPSVLRLLLENGVILPLAAPMHVVNAVRARAPAGVLEHLPTDDLFWLAMSYVANGEKDDGIKAVSSLTGCTPLAAKGALEGLYILSKKAGVPLGPEAEWLGGDGGP